MWELEAEPGLCNKRILEHNCSQKKKASQLLSVIRERGKNEERVLLNEGRDILGTILRRVFPTSSDPPFSCVSLRLSIHGLHWGKSSEELR